MAKIAFYVVNERETKGLTDGERERPVLSLRIYRAMHLHYVADCLYARLQIEILNTNLKMDFPFEEHELCARCACALFIYFFLDLSISKLVCHLCALHFMVRAFSTSFATLLPPLLLNEMQN